MGGWRWLDGGGLMAVMGIIGSIGGWLDGG